MRILYPEIEPNHRYELDVDALHRVYMEESGNPDGIPVVFLHGGPGAGSSENHRRYFDPTRYRIINFDQRGCHRSRPVGEIRNNTTADLIADIEQIRSQLAIERWLVFGGSWGATLGLLYAQEHPGAVLAMILRGTFLARRGDLDWFTRAGASRIFPDVWQRFKGFIPEAEQHDLVQAYYRRLTSTDPFEVDAAARHWAEWAGRVVTYLLDIGEFVLPADITDIINEVRIETHYGSHHYFIEENQILRDINRLADVPVHLIHGRRDLTCTLDASWSLHQAIPHSELSIINEGGHLAGEPVMTDALVRATDQMADRLG